MSPIIWIQRILALTVGLFYATTVIIGAILANFKHPLRFFSKKNRDSPPKCLNDESLGQHHYVSLKDVKLHYVANGEEGKPLMLFVHGFPEFWYSWRFQMKEFSKDYRVVAVDQRGFATSDKPAGVENYSLDKLSNDIKELIHALGYNSCVLVAHDWGGFVCWFLAALHPELIDRLILMNIPHPYAFRKYIFRSWTQFKKSWYVFLFQVPIIAEVFVGANDWKFIDIVFKGTKSMKGVNNTTDEDIEAYKYAMSRPGAITAGINYYRCSMRYPTNRKIPQIKVPTLLIWGTGDAALDTPLAALSGAYVNNFTLEYIKGGSHFIQVDCPDEVNKFMRTFLK